MVAGFAFPIATFRPIRPAFGRSSSTCPSNAENPSGLLASPTGVPGHSLGSGPESALDARIKRLASLWRPVWPARGGGSPAAARILG
jgi:hypothetical protein